MIRVIFLLLLLGPGVAAASVLTVDVRPYSVCTPAGCGENNVDPGRVRSLLAQADITTNFLAPLRVDLPGSLRTARGDLDASAALAAFRSSVGQTVPHTIYLGLTTTLDGVFGLAYRNMSAQQVFPFALIEGNHASRFVSLVAAHEIAHVLGASHVSNEAGDNLMRAGIPPRAIVDPDFIPPILDETRDAARSSPLLAEVMPVPAPAPAALAVVAFALLLALPLIGGARRRVTVQP